MNSTIVNYGFFFHNGAIYFCNYQRGAEILKIPTKGKLCQNGTI